MVNVLENVDVVLALNKTAKRSTEIVESEYFVKDNGENYVFKNLNATAQLIEKECPGFLKQLVEQNKGEKLTLKQFHKVIISVLNQ